MLLLVIIGAALIAFIIGDFFTSGRTLFGTGTTIAKVGEHKIDVQEFQRRVEQANQQAQQSGQKMDQALLQQQVLNQMISERLYQQEINDLGLKVTDSELTDAMLGNGSAYLDRLIQSQTGLESAAMLHDMAFNPVKYGMDEAQAMQLRSYWLSLEQQMEQTLLQQKFQNLFAGTLVANELDAKALYDDNASTAHVAYVKKDYSSLADDKYEVTDGDIEKEWAKHKEAYKLPEEVRTVSYITVDIAPSSEDLLAAEQRVENALLALRNSTDTEGLADMTDFVVDRRKAAAASIRDNAIRRFADTASVGQSALVSRVGNDYTLSKLLGKSSEVDSVNVDYLAVAGTAAQIDSIVKVLNGGATFESLASDPQVQGAQQDMWVSLVDPQMSSLRPMLAGNATGVYFTPDTAATQGGRILRVNSRKAPVPVYDLAVITFTAEPSNATINQLQANLQNYLNANTDAAAFNGNAVEAGYQTFPAQVSASTPQISRMPDTRGAVNWAMSAKKGAVSPIFGDEQTGRFMAVAVTDIYDDYTPARDPQVRAFLTNTVRNQKKAADLIEQYKGKASDMAGYAQLMESAVDTTDVTFGQIMIPKLGIGEAEIMAQTAVAQPNQLVGPVEGKSGVVVLQVTGVDNQGRPFNFDESANTFARTRGAYVLGGALDRILLGDRQITNNMLKFFRE